MSWLSRHAVCCTGITTEEAQSWYMHSKVVSTILWFSLWLGFESSHLVERCSRNLTWLTTGFLVVCPASIGSWFCVSLVPAHAHSGGCSCLDLHLTSSLKLTNGFCGLAQASPPKIQYSCTPVSASDKSRWPPMTNTTPAPFPVHTCTGTCCGLALSVPCAIWLSCIHMCAAAWLSPPCP